MAQAPTLTVAEVRQEVERIFRRDHRSHLVALYGQGEADEFEFDGKRWRIIPTRCELDLREHLPRPDGKGPFSNVYLVDWAQDLLPLDVSCRLAGGRLYHVARDARLAALFGARHVEPGLAGGSLAKLYLSGALPQPRKIQGLQLTRAVAWEGLLETKFKLPSSRLKTLGAFLGWAATHEGGPAFVQQASSDDLWRNVRRELGDWIRSALGDAAAVVWQAWELGLAARLLEVLPLLNAKHALDDYLAGQLAGQLSAWLPDLAGAVKHVEAALATNETIVGALPADRRELLSILERSQALAESAGLGAVAAQSDLLPGGHQAREQELGDATERFVEKSSPDGAADLVGVLIRLEAHFLDEHLRGSDHREARKSLGRIALWCCAPDGAAPDGTRWQPAADLARRYSEEGGYLEWARQQLRGLRGANEHLLKAAQRLEQLAADALQKDHRAFAEAYIAWVETGKPSGSVTPIEDLGQRVIAPFLKADERRKLLVVLMDGMSHATAVQILTRLGENRRWGPIAWRQSSWNGAFTLPPVLAVAPTLTELSRAAFFAGKADPKFGEQGTDKDPERWKSNRAVASMLDDDAPPLFLRRDILSGRDLADDIRDAIRGDSRAVAVVVNAVDEDLSGSVQVAKDYSLAPVLPLEALLSAAEEGERVVLLAADHGHIFGDGAQTLSGRLGNGRPGGPRWRALAEDETPDTEEVVLPSGTWVPRGWDRVATLWDPSVVNRSAKYGEHGGLSLGEAVAPAVLIAPEWLERAMPDDSDLAVRPLPTPAWWDLEVRRPRAATPATTATPTRKPQAGQMELLARDGAPAPTPPPPMKAPRVDHPLVEALQKSTIFKSQVEGRRPSDIESVLDSLAIIADAGDAMSDAEFARKAQTSSRRVAGLVARMGMLNCDGYAMVEYDRAAKQIVLKRQLLVQQYGLKL